MSQMANGYFPRGLSQCLHWSRYKLGDEERGPCRHKKHQYGQQRKQQHVQAANAFCFMAQGFIVVLVLINLLQCRREVLWQRQTYQDRSRVSCRSSSHQIVSVLERPFLRSVLQTLQAGKGLPQQRPWARQVPTGYSVAIAERHGKA